MYLLKYCFCTILSFILTIGFWVGAREDESLGRSVSLENTALVKFIRNYIRDPSGGLRILMTPFPAFSLLFLQTVGEKKNGK